MKIDEISVNAITPAKWNANRLPPELKDGLRRSIELFGMIVPLAVREVGNGTYETVGGAHRLEVALGMGLDSVPCVVVEADDADARLLSQALNNITGEDNPGLKADLINHILSEKTMDEIVAVLPGTAESLTALASLGEDDLAESLQQWQASQAAQLKHMTFQLLETQLEIVEETLKRVDRIVDTDESNPNRRGVALYELCRFFLKSGGEKDEL